MRRITLALVLCGAAVALAPATALAAKHHRHAHHARHHVRHVGQENDANAGTVMSFQNGILTISTSNGPLSGRVTPNTEVRCEASGMPTSMQRDDHGDRGDDNDNDNQQHCSVAQLLPGAVVREAELRISGAGQTWEKVELVTSQAGDNENDD